MQLLKNKTDMFQSVGNEIVRPWRTVEVADGVEFDSEKFELVSSTETKSKKKKDGE